MKACSLVRWPTFFLCRDGCLVLTSNSLETVVAFLYLWIQRYSRKGNTKQILGKTLSREVRPRLPGAAFNTGVLWTTKNGFNHPAEARLQGCCHTTVSPTHPVAGVSGQRKVTAETSE